MKPILYIVAILAAGGAAYFSLQNANNFKDQQKLRLTTIEENRNVTGTAEKTEGELKDEQGALKTVQDQRDLVSATIETLKSNEISLKREVGELDGTLEEQNAELKSLERTLDEIKLVLGELGPDVNIDNFPDKITEIEDTKKNLERELEDKQTLVAGAENRLSKNKAEANRLTEKKKERNDRMGDNAKESMITAVSQDWGFVVIGAGSSTGFTPQTTLLVKRDGKLIGRVRPSSIERTQTVADVILESLAPGVRLQPGDRVILAKPASN
jgi:FKBP-type peptidyl-prolyl cis-trans isomerase